MENFTGVEKFMLANTLNSIPLLLEGRAVLIDLRNETSVAGRIADVDGFMNVSLEEAVFIDRHGLQYPFDQFMVRDRMIRQIHLPPDFKVEKELREFVKHGLHKKRPKLRENAKRTFKMKRAQTRHKEILHEIAKGKLEKRESEKASETIADKN